MWEIATRQLPFDGEEFGPNGRTLRVRIRDGLRPDPARAAAALDNADYIAIMTQCWHQDAAARPTMARAYDGLVASAGFDRRRSTRGGAHAYFFDSFLLVLIRCSF